MKAKQFSTKLTLFAFFLLSLSLAFIVAANNKTATAEEIPNELIDASGFKRDVEKSLELRKARRISEDDFLKMSKEADTVILDARNPMRFAQLHIVGAKNLNFAEFTEETLKALLPSKNTRILIYCNNNIKNSPVAFASKIAPAALNLSTYTSLVSYGYTNVYELGPVVDPAKSKIKFEGSLSDLRIVMPERGSV